MKLNTILSISFSCRAQAVPNHTLNPRSTGTPDFPSPTGGGGGRTPPRLSRLLLVVEKNGKIVRKFVKNNNENISVNFSVRSKVWPPGPKNGQIFESFAIVKHPFGKPPLSQELLYLGANPKTAFEREVNFALLRSRQISHKVDGLPSKGHRSKKTVFERNLSPRITFFIFICRYDDNIVTIVFVSSRRIELYICRRHPVKSDIS